MTDPAFLHRGGHVDLGHGIWARREVEPACQVADLPPVDLIVLSHYHGDHFDDVAARDLDKDLPVISTADAVGKLRPLGSANGYPLDTWGSHRVEKGDARVTITAMPALHAADEATAALLIAIPIHYNDFSVFMSGLDDFKKAAEASSAGTEFRYLAHGETYTFTPATRNP